MNDLSCFAALGITEPALVALEAKGFTAPTPIQKLVIPKLLAGERDLIGQAQTGTGKTAAFGLPILEKVSPGQGVQSLILAPTRELSIQIADEMTSFCGARKVKIAPFFGGQPIEIQIRELKSGVDVVVGTPGRILDLMRRNVLKLDKIDFAVLDEADEMLDMGFIEDIETILAECNPLRRTMMFSATMPDAIRAIAEKFMRDPEIVRAETEVVSGELTDQFYFEVRREEKLEALCRILSTIRDCYGLIFCRTRLDVDDLVEKLKARNFAVEALHGEISQAQRLRTIQHFKERKFPLLVATDVAARGIGVNDLTHVINYALPLNAEIYIHRIGRTGRAGKRGCAVTLVTPGEAHRFSLIRQSVKVEIKKAEIPGVTALIEGKKADFSALILEMISSGKHLDYLNFAEELCSVCDNPADVIGAMLKLRFKDTLLASHYPEIGAARKAKGRKNWQETPDDPAGKRVYIGVGKTDGYGAVRMLDFLWERAKIKKSRVGRIDCFDRFSFVNLTAEDAKLLIKRGEKMFPRIAYAEDVPENHAPAPRPSSPAPEKKGKDKREDSRKLKAWIEEVSSGVELKAKRPKRKK